MILSFGSFSNRFITFQSILDIDERSRAFQLRAIFKPTKFFLHFYNLTTHSTFHFPFGVPN